VLTRQLLDRRDDPQWPVPHAGMPPMGGGPPLSRFEFWPMWRFYAPIFVWAAWLSLRHGGLRLPLLANPLFPAGGLVGESKSQVLDLIGGEARDFVSPYIRMVRSSDPEADVVAALAALAEAGLALPVVAKPDLGCRGAGVRPVRSRIELLAYLEAFPAGEALLLQKMVDVEGEAGVFYVRVPGEKSGSIFSLTLKYFPHVIGDGSRNLRELIMADPRAGQVPHLYLPRHQDRLATIPSRGEPVRLAFAGSHSRGAIFRDGTHLVTEAMRARFDAIAAEIPEFWFGRFDIRFADFAEVQEGRGFKIVECNGAGAEATHIWDARTRLRDAWCTLFQQYSLLWRIGAANRRRGFRPESWRDFFARQRHEHSATLRYPTTA
jgi:hypothetical protein